MAYIFLSFAILTEIIGTTLLKASEGFSKIPLFIMGFISFGIALVFMTISFKTIPLSIGYAIWSGVGTAGTAIIGFLIWKEKLSISSYTGMVLIVIGVILLNVPSTR
ncbi:DMT family transporter [Virgibacillus sp. W0430]|uniref:DMT family transporter n=1 Tax=Virgibacillus sp. W0430 TaxID=3391580 RepID=UPI003F48BFF9